MTSASDFVARAMHHHRSGRIAEAEADYREALRREPNSPDALHLLGVIMAGRGRTAEALTMMERSLELSPYAVEAHINLANLLAGLSRIADAESHFRTAESLRPHSAEVANGIGGCALRAGRYDEAEVWLRKALSRDPECVTALVNLGTLMDSTGRHDETVSYYERAIAAKATYAEAHQYRALALLARGRLEEGWREYEWRFERAPAFKGRFKYPHWKGEALSGRKILVWTEQGLGDEILTLSMVPDLLTAGARVVLVCSPRLTALVGRTFPDIDIIPRGGQPARPGVTADIEFQASMSDLGLHLRPSFALFPQRSAYLRADNDLTLRLKARYRQGGDQLVGISWRSKSEDGAAEKTIDLEHWAPVLRAPGVRFVNLQYGDTLADLERVERLLGTKVLTDPEVNPMGDLDAFASQVAAMDIVITVSNTTAHVAGSVGARTWTLVPGNTGRLWYWFLERTDSPWYPTLRLFRQHGRTWEEAIAKVASALAMPNERDSVS